jgi:hypothetical protein
MPRRRRGRGEIRIRPARRRLDVLAANVLSDQTGRFALDPISRRGFATEPAKAGIWSVGHRYPNAPA